jgi:hypothetical protein
VKIEPIPLSELDSPVSDSSDSFCNREHAEEHGGVGRAVGGIVSSEGSWASSFFSGRALGELIRASSCSIITKDPDDEEEWPSNCSSRVLSESARDCTLSAEEEGSERENRVLRERSMTAEELPTWK